MEAAAHGHSTIGIPQSVGKEFVAADDDKTIKSAGIVYLTPAGEILLEQRGMEQDHPGEWAFPGGHLDKGEYPLDAALREFQEEVGHQLPGAMPMGQWGKFASFSATGPRFDVTLSDESQSYLWANLDNLPQPMHPRALEIIQSEAFTRIGMNELHIAEAMRDGRLTSPQRYENLWLFAMRITGTGKAYRTALKEHVWRDPADYLNPEFLARCMGLSVIWEHPPKDMLDSAEWTKRVVGSIFLPYLSGDEVWGIAKILDDEAGEFLSTHLASTSPAVVFRDPGVNSTLTLANGETVMVEGKPSLLDHLAICEVGVWDKGGPAAGVLSTTAEVSVMTPEEQAAADKARKDAEGSNIDKLLSAMDSVVKRLDSMEEKFGKKDADMPSEPMQVAADRKDGDETEDEKAAREAKEKESKADKAARKDAQTAVLAALQAEVAGLKSAAAARATLSDSDLDSISTAQDRAHRALMAFGDSAPRPVDGESAESYRRRVLKRLQPKSRAWSEIDLSTLNGKALSIAESQIFADAEMAAREPGSVPEGVLIPTVTMDDTGRKITTFNGSPKAWMSSFTMPSRRLTKINNGV